MLISQAWIARRAWYHVLFFTLGGAQGTVALCLLVASWTEDSAYLSRLSLTLACLAAITVASTAVHSAVTDLRSGQAVLARGLADLAGRTAPDTAQPDWLADLRCDLAALDDPDTIDLAPLRHLQNLARRLH